MKTQGKIYKIQATEQVTEKFSKREFVLEVTNNPAYVQKVLFTLILDNVSKLDSFNVGDEVEVDFNLKGKEWTSPNGEVKYFNTIEAFDIKKMSQDNQSKEKEEELMTRVDLNQTNQEDDDLPF